MKVLLSNSIQNNFTARRQYNDVTVNSGQHSPAGVNITIAPRKLPKSFIKINK